LDFNKIRATLVNRLADQPLFIQPEKLNEFFHRLALVDGEDDLKALSLMFLNPPKKEEEDDSVIAVIPIQGIIFNKADPYDDIFGDSSYEKISDQFKTALSDPSKEKIVFDIDSPGGVTSGMIDMGDLIYNARGEKQIIALVNDYATSAAFAAASSADEIIVTRTGIVGSVGVYTFHVDMSEMDKMMGLNFEYIYYGDNKINGNPHAPLSDEARAEIKEIIDVHGNGFVEMVARNLGQSVKQVKDTQAAVYMGEKAVAQGFAHKLMSVDDAWSSIRTGVSASSSLKKIETKTIKGEVKTMDLETLKKEHPELYAAIIKGETAKAEAIVADLRAKNDEGFTMICDMAARIDDGKTQNEKLEGRVLGLEKSETLRQEFDMAAHAEKIWTDCLTESEIPEHLHPKVMNHVKYTGFLTEGVLDETKFKAAIEAEINDWVEKGVKSSVIGTGVVVKKAADDNSDTDEEDAAIVATLLNFVGEKVPATT